MKIKHPFELAAFVLLLVVFNFAGVDAATSALFPGALWNGEAWRWFTYPWAHVSNYHLVLDAAAFLCLYETLRCKASIRLLHLLSCIIFSGLCPVLFDPRLETIGLRGLSGVAHGLMIVTSLEAVSSKVKGERVFGFVVLAGVIVKCVVEVVTGAVVFADYHLGNVGLPVPMCHFGGAVGGILSFALATVIGKESRSLGRETVLIPKREVAAMPGR